MSVRKLQQKSAMRWRSITSFRAIAIALCAIILAVIAGPFGTSTQLNGAERFALWGPLIVISLPLAWLATFVAHKLVTHPSIFLTECVAVTVMTGVYAPCVWFYLTWFEPNLIAEGVTVGAVWVYVFGVVAIVSVMRRVALATRTDEVVTGHDVSAASDPRLLQRLPTPVRAPVLRLTAMDHRIEVVTQAGTEKLRLRLRDAVREMEPVEGFMAHRSHWVAKEAVVDTEKNGSDKVYLKLANGDLVPVSRTFRADWVKAGLLDNA